MHVSGDGAMIYLLSIHAVSLSFCNNRAGGRFNISTYLFSMEYALMPRYFFHVANQVRDLDRQGTELNDNAAARKEAIRFAGAMINEDPDVLWDGRDFRIEVTDMAGQLLFTIITLSVDAPASGKV